MAEVTVSGEDYVSYADLETADVYALAATHAEAFREEDEDGRGRSLVTATRTLDRQVWLEAYNTFELRLAQPNIVTACIELAIALSDGSEAQENQNTAERFRSITAGSVSLTNFRGIDNPTRFPQIVQELLKPFLGGSGDRFHATATGVDAETIFPVDLGINGGL